MLSPQNKCKLAYLNLASWSGTLMGAQHWYARLRYYDLQGRYQSDDVRYILTEKTAQRLNDWDDTTAHRPGTSSSRFWARQDAIQAGIKTTKKVEHLQILCWGIPKVHTVPKILWFRRPVPKGITEKLEELYNQANLLCRDYGKENQIKEYIQTFETILETVLEGSPNAS